jgi:CheY-like chemotaxis protein
VGVLPRRGQREGPRLAAERRPAIRRGEAVDIARDAARAALARARAAQGHHRGEAALKQPRGAGGDRVTRPRILIIDDDELLCEAIHESLGDEYAVASAPHGAAALELAKSHEPAVILLDLRMPIMDGWSFVQQYRQSASVPAAIIVMSAAPDVRNITGQLGAHAHIQKPFDLETLNTLVATHAKGRSAEEPRSDPPNR